MTRTYTIETEQETDGRYIAEVMELPGVMVYGKSEDEARSKAGALALRVLADEIEQNESAELSNIAFSRA
jgi:predicted RNase H-like HicB family nuclease